MLPQLRQEYALDFIIANAENSAGGSGITLRTAFELFECGVDVLTAGDHIWKKKDIFEMLVSERRIVRPVNFPSGAPGSGATVFKTKKGLSVGVISVLGRVFMEPLECPFKTSLQALEELKKETNVVIIDVHAEATSEKIALGWYLDGKASAIIGTHTHVQTADEKILPQGTAYLTDAGMTGPCDSVIGRRIEDVLAKFLTGIPVRFEVADQNVQLQAAVVGIDEASGKALSITRIQKKIS